MPVSTTPGRITLLRRANVARKRGLELVLGTMSRMPVTRPSANDGTDDDNMTMDSVIIPGGVVGDWGYVSAQSAWMKSAAGTARFIPKMNADSLAQTDLSTPNITHSMQSQIWANGSQLAQEMVNSVSMATSSSNAILARTNDLTVDWTFALTCNWTTQPIALNEWIRLHKWLLKLVPVL